MFGVSALQTSRTSQPASQPAATPVDTGTPAANAAPAAPTRPPDLISAEDLQKLQQERKQLEEVATRYKQERNEEREKLSKGTFRSVFEWTKENPKSARQLFVVGFIAIFVLIIIIYMITLPEPECSYLNKQVFEDIDAKIGLNGFVLRVDFNLTSNAISSTPRNLVTVATSDQIKSSRWAPADAIELVLVDGHPRLTLYGINVDTKKEAYFDDYTVPTGVDVEMRFICHENMCVLRVIRAGSSFGETFLIRPLARLERELTFKYIKVADDVIGRSGKIPKVELYALQDKKLVADQCYLKD